MRFGHTIDESRKKYPEITDELLENLQKWAKDRGLPRVPKEQLALFAHSCYFDMEATKRCMHVYYRMRATIPEFFSKRDSSLDYLQHSLRALEFVMLPKPDKNGNRIIFHRLADSRPSEYMFNDGIKLLLMSIDASLYTDGCSPGYIFLFDMVGVRLGHLPRLSINSIRRFFEYLYTGNVSDIYPHIPPECLPKDFGGELDCVASLHKTHCMKLDHLRNYFREEEFLFRCYLPDNVKTADQKIISDATKDLKDHQW